MKIIIEGSAEEIKKYRDLIGNEVSIEIKEETSFKVGDTVKALANGHFGDVKAGDIGKITDIVSGGSRPIEVTTDDDYDFFHPQDLELVEGQSYKPTEGDIVVITANTNNSRNKVGDIGKVGIIGNGVARVDVPNRPSKAGEYGNWTFFHEMRPATDEEKERYEQAVKWAKFGRQPNEFKKGDIVRIKENQSGHAEGSVVEVKEVRKSHLLVEGDSQLGFTSYGASIDCVELVAPVEARVDR